MSGVFLDHLWPYLETDSLSLAPIYWLYWQSDEPLDSLGFVSQH